MGVSSLQKLSSPFILIVTFVISSISVYMLLLYLSTHGGKWSLEQKSAAKGKCIEICFAYLPNFKIFPYAEEGNSLIFP